MSNRDQSEELVADHIPNEDSLPEIREAKQRPTSESDGESHSYPLDGEKEVFEEVIVPEKKLVIESSPIQMLSHELPSSPELYHREQENTVNEVVVVSYPTTEVITDETKVFIETMQSPILSRNLNTKEEYSSLTEEIIDQPTTNINEVQIGDKDMVDAKQQVKREEKPKEKEVFILTREEVRKARISETEYKKTTIKVASPKYPLERKQTSVSENTPAEQIVSASVSNVPISSPITSRFISPNNNTSTYNANGEPTPPTIPQPVAPKTSDETLFTVPAVPRHKISANRVNSLRDFRCSSPIQRSSSDESSPTSTLQPPSLNNVASQARGVKRVQSSISRFNGPKGWGVVSSSAEPGVKDFRGSLYSQHELKPTPQSSAYTTSSSSSDDNSPSSRHRTTAVVAKSVARSDSLKGASRRTGSIKHQQRSEWSKNARRYSSLVSLNESAIQDARLLSSANPNSPTVCSTDHLATVAPSLSSTTSANASQANDTGCKESAAKSLQLQYTDLQEQFSKWQTQLAANQRVVTENMVNNTSTRTTSSNSKTTTGNLNATPTARHNSPTSPLVEENDGSRKTNTTKTRNKTNSSDSSFTSPLSDTENRSLASCFSADELVATKQILRPNCRPTNSMKFQARTRAGSPPHDILLCRSMETTLPKTVSPPPPPSPSVPEPTTLPIASARPNPRRYRQLDPPKLDTREELMLAIRNSSHRKLSKVSILLNTIISSVSFMNLNIY